MTNSQDDNGGWADYRTAHRSASGASGPRLLDVVSACFTGDVFDPGARTPLYRSCSYYRIALGAW